MVAVVVGAAVVVAGATVVVVGGATVVVVGAGSDVHEPDVEPSSPVIIMVDLVHRSDSSMGEFPHFSGVTAVADHVVEYPAQPTFQAR